jgi:hypothetical protein
VRSSHLISTVRSPRGTGGWELGTKNLPDLSSRMLLHHSALAMWHPTLSVGDNPAQSRRIAILKSSLYSASYKHTAQGIAQS